MAEQKYVCPNCSGLIDYGTRFCPHCGNALGNWGNAYSSAPVNTNVFAVKEESFFEKYFSTKGRLNRKAAFLRNLSLGVGASVISFMLGIIGGNSMLEGDLTGYLITVVLCLIICTVMFYSSLTINIRRCHDLDKSGLYIFATLLIIPAFKLVFAKGTTGPNKYGPDPLAGKY